MARKKCCLLYIKKYVSHNWDTAVLMDISAQTMQTVPLSFFDMHLLTARHSNDFD